MPKNLDKNKITSKNISKKLNEKRNANTINNIQKHCNLSNTLYQEFDDGLYERKKKGIDLKARIFIYNITIIKDELKLFEPIFTISYKDIIYDEDKIIENVTFDELANKLYDERIFTDEIPQI